MRKILTVLLAAISLNANEVVNFFKLDSKADKQGLFRAVGEANIKASEAKENGTLAMISAGKKGSENENFVLEIYADEKAYEAHRNGEHFKKFLSDSADLLKNKIKIEVKAEYIGEQKHLKNEIRNAYFRYAMLDIKPKFNENFKTLVLEEMKDSIRLEKGVLALYALTQINEPNIWHFIEIYKDEAAYEAHRKTQHFVKFFEGRKGMVESFISEELVNLQSFSRAWYASKIDKELK